jgi:acetyl esterase/lipase
MRPSRIVVLLLVLAALGAMPGYAQIELPYSVTPDLVYGEAKDQQLQLDVFVPNGKGRFDYLKPGDSGKGLGLIDCISGGWNSRRARQEEHERAGVFKVFCARGYTVFAIRPGSLPDFTALEMVENLRRGIRWVKAHAAEYGIDPNRLGLLGASAGGHLSTLTMLSVEPADPAAADPLLRFDTSVKAVSVFFPPTDFLNWNGKPMNYDREPALIFSGGIEGKSEEQLRAAMLSISPARLVRGKTPPLFLIHGDADPIVPLQQSQVMVDAMKAAANEVSLYVKAGGGHFWLTIPEEIILMADWFDKHL